MFDLTKLISAKYLFAIDSTMLHRSDRGFMVLGIALIVAGIVMRLTGYYAPNQFSRKLWQRLSALALTIGALELIWFGFRYENITVFGTHAAALIILASGFIWLGYILKYRLTKYSSEVKTWQRNEVKQKYLHMK